MIKELKEKANLYVNAGVLSLIIYFGGQELEYVMPAILNILGLVSVMVGCIYYALSKGYNKMTGVFLGLFGVIGWLAIYFLRDKTNEMADGAGIPKNV